MIKLVLGGRIALMSFALLYGMNVAHAGYEVSTFVAVVAGASNYNTYGPTPVPTNSLFFLDTVGIPSNPLGLAASDISGTYRYTTSGAPTLTDDYSLAPVTFNSTFGLGSFGGTAGATASSGKIGAQATGVYTGLTGSNVVAGSQGFATFKETFNILPQGVTPGTVGYFDYDFMVEGSLSAVGGLNGYGIMKFKYQAENALDNTYVHDLLGFYASTNNAIGITSGTVMVVTDPRFVSTIFNQAFVNGFPVDRYITNPALAASIGYTMTGNSISGKSTFRTERIPIVFGQDFDFSAGISSMVRPGVQEQNIQSLFRNTATLNGIHVYDAMGNAISNFTVTAASGTQYNANGLVLSAAAPEPGTLSLFLPLVGMMLYQRHLRRGKMSK